MKKKSTNFVNLLFSINLQKVERGHPNLTLCWQAHQPQSEVSFIVQRNTKGTLFEQLKKKAKILQATPRVKDLI